MALTEYHRKRNFLQTPEPRGKQVPHYCELGFVIQKHDAYISYDFRLAPDGTLKKLGDT